MNQTNRGGDAKKIALRIRIKSPDFAAIGKNLFTLPKNTFNWFRNLRLEWKFLAAALVIILGDLYGLLSPFFQENSYALGSANALLPQPSTVMADKIKYDPQQQTYNFAGQTSDSNIMGKSTTAPSVLPVDASKGIKVSDPTNKVDFSMTPLYHLAKGKQQGDRIVYPMSDGTGWAVYTMQGIGVKEDVVLSYAPGRTMQYKYKLQLGDSLAAKVESDGSLGVYGNTLFASNISAGTDKDAALLQKARKNAPKNKLLFIIPKPVVNDKYGESGSVSASYALDGNTLSVNVKGLAQGKYPLTIDPSIYVVTASQFMYGNNETNINFDVANKLIKKGNTTGARFNSWNSTTSLQAGIFGAGAAASGGFVYSIGGQSFTGQVFTAQGSGTYTVPSGVTSITVKAWGGGGGGGGGGGAAGGTGGTGGGAGYTNGVFTVSPGDSISVYVGGGGQGGIYDNSGRGTGGGGSGGGYSSVTNTTNSNQLLAIAAGGAGGGGGRISTAGGAGGPGGCSSSATSCNGTAGGSSGGGGGGTSSTGGSAGAGSSSNNGTAGSSLTGGPGADGRSGQGNDGSGVSGGLATGGAGGLAMISASYPGGGGGGSGYFGGGGGGTNGTSSNSTGTSAAGGGGGGDYTANSCTGTDTCTAGSGTAPGQSSDTDRNGAGTGGSAGAITGTGGVGSNGIVIVTVTGSTTDAAKTVSWDKFDTGNGTINSPDPGSGTCSGWCSTSDYNLPTTTSGASNGRSNFSMVAYNGYLYVMGGSDDRKFMQKTVLIAKLGANGEPRLWHPTDSNKANWVYWYQDSDLNSARVFAGAVAYNNKMYIIGGLTGTNNTALSGGAATATVEYANIKPSGTLGSWSTTTSLNSPGPGAIFGMSAQVYNGYIYVLGGQTTVTTAPITGVYYTKMNSSGTLNTWTSTSAFTTGRSTFGGNFAVIWGGYIYISSGCSAVNGSTGYCTTIATDAQVASINTDGSLDVWNTVGGVSDSRMGHNLLAWRNNIYIVGGCAAQNATTGKCDTLLATINYGAVNQDGDASTVGSSSPSGTSPCSGGAPTGCDLPGTGNIGNIFSSAVIYNGYLYVIGGCTATSCNSQSANTAYVAITSNGVMSKPATCPSGGYQGSAWCVDNVHTISGGVAAAAQLVYNGRIYIIGGFNGPSNSNIGNINYTSVNSDGSISAWATPVSMTGIGATAVSMTYAYARANPSSAGSNPGNLYIFGGCSAPSSGGGCSTFTGNVYKCNIGTSGAPASCSTTSQLQIGTYPGASGAGLAAMGGTVYANYVYLIGGQTPSSSDLNSVIYAKIDNSNNIVTVGSGWTVSSNTLITSRQRAAAFGYNGYIYVVGGYNAGGGGVLNDIEFIKMNTSDGSLGSATDSWHGSSVTINQRWGLSVPVNNSYAYVIGGCSAGSSPSCSTASNTIQTFQVYNNDSGSTAGFNSGNAVGTGGTPVDRLGGSATILNGFIYFAGGCSDMACTTPVSNTYFASINADGTMGTWASGGALPAARTFGKLLAAGGTLYYVGGQTGSATTTAVNTIYYTSSFSSGNPTWNGSAATKGIGDSGSGAQARTQFGATVWNNRLYVLGGYNSSGTVQSTVYSSPQQSSGGNITNNWTDGSSSPSNTAFNIARAGLSAVAYANNLYILGGVDTSTNYLSDTQYAQINTTDGSVGSWTYSESLPVPIQQGEVFAVNGYIYWVGGRTASTTCGPNVFVAPISANTTIASGNNPTGVGSWFRANNEYTGDRYGAGVAYSGGKMYVLAGGCSSFVGSGDRSYLSGIKSQPQVAKYSIMFDNDTDVYPKTWLINGLDNSIGASWQLTYQSMTDPNHTWSGTIGQACSAAAMSDWGQATTVNPVTLGNLTPDTYTPLDGSGTNTSCARYFDMQISIDASPTFGYPDDVSRGPTVTDITLSFTADPSKRLMHGRTFVGGLSMPIDTPKYP